MNVDGIILAAGLSVRMGTNKLLLPFRGKPLLQHAIDLAASLPLASLTLVTREETLAGLSVPKGLRVAINPDPGAGQSGSMRLGLAHAQGGGYLFFQGDQPLLDAATARAVLALADAENIVLPAYGGVPGNPVYFAAAYRDALLGVHGDCGGRAVRDRYKERCRVVEVPGPAPLLDIDTPEQYKSLLEMYPG